MPRELDVAVRRYVAEGSGISPMVVQAGNADLDFPAGPEAATVLPISDGRRGWMNRYRPPGPGSQPFVTHRRRTYDVQFYARQSAPVDALDRAVRLDAWAQSDDGLVWADTAYADGTIKRLVVLDGGAYTEPPAIQIDGGGGSGATATAVMANGAIAAARLTDRGRGYSDTPQVIVSGGGATRHARITAVGSGFAVRFPLAITQLDEPEFHDDFERRASITMAIDYFHVLRQDVGTIDRVSGTMNFDGRVLNVAPKASR